MPITMEQLEKRRHHIGASDVPKIMGVDSFGDALTVYLEKVGLSRPFPGNEYTELGNYLEPVLLKMAADKLGYKIRQNQRRVRDVFAANLDALVMKKPIGFEAKSTVTEDGWGPDGSHEVPDKVLLQTQTQMYCADLEVVYVPALIGGRFRLYRVERDGTLIDMIVERGTQFWRDHVEAKVPPESVRNKDMLLQMQREAGKVVRISDELYESLLKLKEAKAEVTKAIDEVKGRIVEQLGDAEIGECDLGTLTYKQQSRRTLNAKRLAAAYPDIDMDEFTDESTFYVMREKVAK